MAERLGQYHVRTALIMVAFFALIFALAMQTIRVERLSAELRDREMASQAAIRIARVAEQQARIDAEFALQKMMQNNAAIQRSDAMTIPD